MVTNNRLSIDPQPFQLNSHCLLHILEETLYRLPQSSHRFLPLFLPVTPISVTNFWTDWAGKPQHPPSTGCNHVSALAVLHQVFSVFRFFLRCLLAALFPWHSPLHYRMIFSPSVENRTASGVKVLWITLVSSLHRSAHVNFLLGRSHLVQALWDPGFTALDFLRSSSRLLISAWTIPVFFIGLAFPHYWKRVFPSHCLAMRHGCTIFN